MVFTAIFYLLGKNKTIWHHLMKCNCQSEFEHIESFDKPVTTFDLGSNYPLEKDLKSEIIKNGIGMEKVKYILKKYADK